MRVSIGTDFFSSETLVIYIVKKYFQYLHGENYSMHELPMHTVYESLKPALFVFQFFIYIFSIHTLYFIGFFFFFS